MPMMIEKQEACPNGCGSLEWAYDAQRCLLCGYDALAPHDCMKETQEFRLQNDREWRDKLDHLKAENAKLRALLDFQGEPVEGPIDGVYRLYRDRIEQLEKLSLKAFTVVEWVVGEGILLPPPHFDADDLLLEMVEVLKVKDSFEAAKRVSEVST